MSVDQEFTEKLAKKFLIESELVKKISKDIRKKDFKNIKDSLTSELVEESYGFSKQIGYSIQELLSDFDNDDSNEMILKNILNRLKSELKLESKNDVQLSKDLQNKYETKILFLKKYFIKPYKEGYNITPRDRLKEKVLLNFIRNIVVV